jgi:hypothetical protein
MIVSHFTKLKVQLKDEKLYRKVAEKFGWSITREAVYENPFKYTREKVEDCQVFWKNGKVKMVVDAESNVIHDSYFMGRDALEFLREYSEQYIRGVAANEGAVVNDLGVDATGSRVLEVAYLY